MEGREASCYTRNVETEQSEATLDQSKGRVDSHKVSTEESPYNMLKSCKNLWKQAGSDPYIMSVIEECYKIPFKEIPGTKRSRNNKSAIDKPEFVKIVINPLTAAYNKESPDCTTRRFAL